MMNVILKQGTKDSGEICELFDRDLDRVPKSSFIAEETEKHIKKSGTTCGVSNEVDEVCFCTCKSRNLHSLFFFSTRSAIHVVFIWNKKSSKA